MPHETMIYDSQNNPLTQDKEQRKATCQEMSENIDIISYDTYKRRHHPTIYECRDGVKGWIRETIAPTLIHYGWHICAQEYAYSLFADEKPKAMAKRLILEIHGEEWAKNKQFVYFASRNYHNDFEDNLFVFYKEKDV